METLHIWLILTTITRSHEGQFNKEFGKYYLMLPSLVFQKTVFYGHA